MSKVYKLLYNMKRRISKATIYAICISWSVVTLFPLIFALYSSFKTDNDIYATPFKLPAPVVFDAYSKILSNYSILRGLLNSFFYAATSTFLVIIFALLLSFFVTRYKFPLKDLVTMYFIVGITLPIHASLIPLSVLITNLKLRNTFFGLVFVYIAVTISFGFFVISGYMKSIPKEMDESAVIDGCGPLRLLFSIITPLTTPAIVVAAVIIGKSTYNDLMFGSLLVTKKELITLSLSLLTLKTQQDVKVNAIFAAVCISITPVLILYSIFQKGIEQGLTAGAVKM